MTLLGEASLGCVGGSSVLAPTACAGRRRAADPIDAADPILAELASLSTLEPRRQRLRELVIIACLPVAQREALRFRRGAEPFEDLLQVAVIGLILAVDRYDVARGVPFRHFAVPTIAGELRRHFRDRTWSLRVSRREQELSTLIRRREPELAQRLGRQPSTRDIAVALGLSQREVVEGRVAAAARSAVSLHTPLFADGQPMDLGDTVGGPDAALESLADRDALRRALAALPGEVQLLLRLRYVEELTQQQIADRLGTSQMQVSRLISRALRLLRAHMLGQP